METPIKEIVVTHKGFNKVRFKIVMPDGTTYSGVSEAARALKQQRTTFNAKLNEHFKYRKEDISELRYNGYLMTVTRIKQQ